MTLTCLLFSFIVHSFPFPLGSPEPTTPPAPLTLDTQNLLMSQRIKCARRDEKYLVFKWDQQGMRKHFMQANSLHENKNKDGVKTTLFVEKKHGWSVCRSLVTWRLILVYDCVSPRVRCLPLDFSCKLGSDNAGSFNFDRLTLCGEFKMNLKSVKLIFLFVASVEVDLVLHNILF